MKRLLLGLIVVSAFLVLGHQYLLLQARVMLTGALVEETGLPATVDSFQGFLPAGRIWLKELHFKSPLPDGPPVDWSVPTLNANLGLMAYLMGSMEIQNVDIWKASWKTILNDSGWTLSGNLNLKGTSSRRPPAGADKDYFWCEQARLTLPSVQGQFKGKSQDLLFHSSLDISPLCLKGGDFLLPCDFNLSANLSTQEDSTRLSARGRHTPKEKKIEVDLRLVDVEVPVLERYLEIASQIPDFPPLKARDWIRGGSVSIQLRVSAQLTQVNGDLTLRLRKVQFGPEIIDSELTGETLRPILDGIQTRQDTLQLGPVSFTENLLTPQSEAWDKIQQGMVSELIKNDPGAAFKAGARMLQDFFKK